MSRPTLAVVGGPDVHQRIELMQRLSPFFRCVAIGSEAKLATLFAAADFEYSSYPLERSFDLRADLASGRRLLRLLASICPDIVHCFDTKPAIFGRLAACAARVPVVVATLPGLGGLYSYDTPRVRRRRWIFERLQTVASEFSSWTVFQNRDDRTVLVERGIVPAGRASVIDGSGVDPGRFARRDSSDREALASELGIRDRRVVLFVGRWIRAKGLTDLLEALPYVEARCPDVVFVALGEGDDGSDVLSDTDAAAVRRAMICLGVRDDVPRLLSIADVVVLPSRYREGIPRALIEAAMVGVPIVTTDTPGCREVVDRGRAGWAVPTGDVAALGRALVEALRHPDEAQRRASLARTNALRRFDLSRIAEQHRLLYDRLLAGVSG